VDTGNTKLIVANTSSGAEELAKKVPRAQVVSAFHTVPSEVLLGVFEARPSSTRPILVYCGDEKRAKDVTAQLIRDSGFDPLEAGPLQIARYTEPFALLVGQLAYEGDGGPQLAYRFKRLRKQTIGKIEDPVIRRSSENGNQKKWVATFWQSVVRVVHRHGAN
jgi:8-hydroxy-5-deazaflavin:NADPH oxidoreductase